ncbi:unnamed protein product [Orchesella dallaii]|uniref:Large ribosomal subunit protein mL50 n=1 Tax=Orchesella dallaii TaxID=48710 RepID=A0ABP1RU47_9HEXA
MLRKIGTWPPQIKEVTSRCVAERTWNASLPLLFYQSVRARSKRETTKHITYSKMGKMRREIPLIDPKLLKKGVPVSATLDIGDMTQARKFEFDVASLNARGFLRFQKPYDPPENAEEKIFELSKTCLNLEGDIGSILKTKLSDPRLKYELLSKAHQAFQHAVPNSMLHMMETVGDVVKFYGTRVNTLTPYEELIRNEEDLPPNLHVQKEPLRFQPGTDLFGQTAFVKSSTIVTGLRAKKKYIGYETKMTWP